MNKRIKELAEQASFKDKEEESIQYFANLIIEDVLKIMSDPVNYNRCVYTTYDSGLANSVVYSLTNKIKEHFKDTP